MKTSQCTYTLEKGFQKFNSGDIQHNAQVVFLFGDRELLKSEDVFNTVRSNYPIADVVGCSTSGEIIGSQIDDGTIKCTAVLFEKTRTKVVHEDVSLVSDSYEIGKKLASTLYAEDLVHIFVLSDGLNINGSELTKGLNQGLNFCVPVSGGLAGDQALFSETVVVHNSPGKSNLVVAVGFYGKDIRVGYGSKGGWESFGVDRLVTKSKGNVLFELDGKPALELYKTYLGEHANQLPASALLFPLSIRGSEPEKALVRTILSVNEDDGSMTFAGDIPEGEYVRLMSASFDKLVDGAIGAAEMSAISLKDSNPDLAILISCVGRKLVLKQRVEEELEQVQDFFGRNTVISGFYSYGEICPTKPFEQNCELHNQTMTITIFKEI